MIREKPKSYHDEVIVLALFARFVFRYQLVKDRQPLREQLAVLTRFANSDFTDFKWHAAIQLVSSESRFDLNSWFKTADSDWGRVFNLLNQPNQLDLLKGFCCLLIWDYFN